MPDNERRDAENRKGGFVAWGIAAALLAVLGTFWAIPRIENDLTGTTKERLAEAGIPTDHLNITAAGRIIRVSGLTASDDPDAIKAAAHKWGVRRVEIDSSDAGNSDNNAGEIATSRLSWATRDKLEISGSVPTAGAKSDLLSAAKSGFGSTATISDAVKVDTAAKASFALSKVSGRLERLSKLLTDAQVDISGKLVTIRGKVSDPDAFAKLVAELEADGVNVDSSATTSTDEPDVSIDWTTSSSTVAGSLPAKADQTAVTGSLAGHGTTAVTGLTAGDASEANASVAALAEQLPTISKLIGAGTATLKGTTVTITGAVAPGDRAALDAALAALSAAGLTVQPDITEAPATSGSSGSGSSTTSAPSTSAPASSTTSAAPTTTALDSASQAIEDQLNAFVKANPIPFSSGSAELLPAADGLLNQITTLLNKATGTNVSVEGYTDSQGEDAANQALSLARAEAVKAALISKGVAANRLTAVGFGETKPVGDNNTPEGRAANRRVIFNLTKGA